jgi:hypothetical protein
VADAAIGRGGTGIGQTSWQLAPGRTDFFRKRRAAVVAGGDTGYSPR